MPRKKKQPSYLDRIKSLLDQRDLHSKAMEASAAALNKVNGVLDSISEAVESATGTAKRGKSKSPAAQKRTRRTFKVSGEASILALLTKGSKTTSEIEKHWKSQGRAGSAANALGKLAREKKLNREPIKDGRGSKYSAA